MSNGKSIVIEFFKAANKEGMSALRRFATADMGFWAPGVGDITMEQYLLARRQHCAAPGRTAYIHDP
jgi:hypothetical protein